jgi:hypothetical protein
MKTPKKRKPHDKNTCFRCRLIALYEEIYKENETRFMLTSMAEACGSLLSQLEKEDTIIFMKLVLDVINEDTDYFSQTIH